MKFTQQIVALSRFNKRLISIGMDITGLLMISVLAVWIRLGDMECSKNIFRYCQSIES